ncbi:uncharacterized protein LOC123293176 isoform X2 [Chrysoperla carnea]|uniref:uncharacterized protein LOC123293176 isoform X2 n=1 Tax=Chrysoperla carnea TaxID=189513 RepID=UPI001D078644|nr:uncharacterized protein LOC123293176 isoform X2 [Chrysoperla carnea]
MNSEKFVNCNLAERIHQYFIISITESDILPRDVCNNCCQKVLETYEFHQDILKAQEFLEKETFHQTKLEIKDEDTDKFFEESYNSMLDSNNSFAEDSLDGEPLIKRDGRKSTEYKGKIKTKILFDQLNKETEGKFKHSTLNGLLVWNVFLEIKHSFKFDKYISGEKQKANINFILSSKYLKKKNTKYLQLGK